VPFPVPNRTGKGIAETRLAFLCKTALEQIRVAVEQALARWGPQRIGVCVGSCDNGTEWSRSAHEIFFTSGAFPAGYDLRLQGAAFPAEYAACYFGAAGPVLALATACASSATAIIRGAELIAAGVCDAVIAGGADIASDTVMLGFAALEAVSPELTNPFSKNRKGINLGDGAAFFVLSREKLEDPGIVLAGYGESADAHHMTSPHPEGQGAIQAMAAALSGISRNAGRKNSKPEISYVNLHGTGTFLNDKAEALAMAAVFGTNQPAASSSKPVTGHTLGAAGALELALCWGVLEKAAAGKTALPLHCWDGVRDEEIPALRLYDTDMGGLAVTEEIRYCMSNSFAFGGCNVSLILGRD
jgi:3-oxoacyl-[acyl-carrier-protein] synthase-1